MPLCTQGDASSEAKNDLADSSLIDKLNYLQKSREGLDEADEQAV